ncbi:hypothetical protein N7495_001661 [Penicillium taxi]|uniref:uncharacterized protein n=1 Tax=Penicillium taxi TaxID=168475 RepID=UPI0025451C8B|nr:uncharacterized protein N7495_001661 [Penicillium taxi]KAJ5908979.1 hypothetical protein N7495_001661 [Penicillium taxi]
MRFSQDLMRILAATLPLTVSARSTLTAAGPPSPTVSTITSTVVSCTTTTPTNLILNPSFEDGSDGWNSYGTIVSGPAEAADGSHYLTTLKKDAANFQGGGSVVQWIDGYISGQIYTLTFDWRVIASDTNFECALSVTSDTNTALGFVTIHEANSWNEFSATFTPTKDGYHELVIQMNCRNSATVTALDLDNFNMHGISASCATSTVTSTVTPTPSIPIVPSAAVSCTTVVPTNLVPNPSFENGISGFWSTRNANAYSNWASGDAADGDHYLQVETSSGITLAQYITFIDGEEYTFVADWRAESTTTDGCVLSVILDTDSNVVVSSSARLLGTAWNSVSGTFKPSGGQHLVQVELYCSISGSSSGYFNIDLDNIVIGIATTSCIPSVTPVITPSITPSVTPSMRPSSSSVAASSSVSSSPIISASASSPPSSVAAPTNSVITSTVVSCTTGAPVNLIQDSSFEDGWYDFTITEPTVAEVYVDRGGASDGTWYMRVKSNGGGGVTMYQSIDGIKAGETFTFSMDWKISDEGFDSCTLKLYLDSWQTQVFQNSYAGSPHIWHTVSTTISPDSSDGGQLLGISLSCDPISGDSPYFLGFDNFNFNNGIPTTTCATSTIISTVTPTATPSVIPSVHSSSSSVAASSPASSSPIRSASSSAPPSNIATPTNSIITSTVVSCTTAVPNLLQNPSFESGFSTWRGSYNRIISGDATDGSYYVQFPDIPDRPWLYQSSDAYISGETYTVSFNWRAVTSGEVSSRDPPDVCTLAVYLDSWIGTSQLTQLTVEVLDTWNILSTTFTPTTDGSHWVGTQVICSEYNIPGGVYDIDFDNFNINNGVATTSCVTSIVTVTPTPSVKTGLPSSTSGSESFPSPSQSPSGSNGSGSVTAISGTQVTGSGSSTPQSTTSTVLATRTATITACPSSVTDCPASQKTTFTTTETIVLSTTVCPVTESTPTTSASLSSGSGSGSGSGDEGFSTSTLFSTRMSTITACPASITNCPASAKTTFVTTETVVVSTTVCPVTTAKATATTSSGSAPSSGSGSGSGDEAFTTSTVFATRTSTVTACPSTVTNCPASAKSTFVTTETIALSTTICPVTTVGATAAAGSRVISGVLVDTSATNAIGVVAPTSSAGSEVSSDESYSVAYGQATATTIVLGSVPSLVATESASFSSLAGSANVTAIHGPYSSAFNGSTSSKTPTTSVVGPLYTGAASVIKLSISSMTAALTTILMTLVVL